MTDEMKAALDNRMLELAGQAIRMLALCTYEGVPADNLPDKGLTLAGVVAIRDDVRPEAVEAIKAVQQAGVQVVMMTVKKQRLPLLRMQACCKVRRM